MKRHCSFVIFIILALFSCNNQNNKSQNINYFIGNQWYNSERTVFKNDYFISHVKYDTTLKKMVGDTAFKINISDSVLIFKKIKELGYYDNHKKFIFTKDTIVYDTVKYNLKYINKIPKLILYYDNFPKIYTSKNKKLNFKETNNFAQIKFRIAGYTIGDQIDKSKIKTRGIYRYANYSIQDCEFLQNKDITFKIIGFNHIYLIERKNIADSKINGIISVVSKKLNQQPEHSPMQKWTKNSDYEYEYYRWSKNDVRITLAKSNYVGDQVYKNIFNNDKWTLYYDDDVKKIVLIETFKDTESPIIQ